MIDSFYAALATELLAINAYVVPLIGEEHVRRNDAPPRLIIFPTTDKFSAPSGPGGNPLPIHDVLETSMVVIHGQTRSVVQGMRDQLVIALRATCKKANASASRPTSRSGSYVLGDGQWTRGSLIVKNGYEYKMTFGVLASIVKRVWELADPEAPAGPDNRGATPDASTYTGDQNNSNAIVAGADVTLTTTVGLGDTATDDDVSIVIPEPEPDPPPEEP